MGQEGVDEDESHGWYQEYCHPPSLSVEGPGKREEREQESSRQSGGKVPQKRHPLFDGEL